MLDRTHWRRIAIAALALAVGASFLAYARDMRDLRARLAANSEIIETRHGAVEVARAGDGPAVVALHGAGGGYDQGLLLASALGGDGFHWIAPSRFGYLRSALPQDPSTSAQADALADLFDTLGVDRVSILAMSGGVPPALQFALRHPAAARPSSRGQGESERVLARTSNEWEGELTRPSPQESPIWPPQSPLFPPISAPKTRRG